MANDEILKAHVAEQQWQIARRKALIEEVVCFIKGSPIELFSFEEVKSSLNLQQKLFRGLQEIPLKNIRGSVGRNKEFSITFLPRDPHLHERWKIVYQVVSDQGLPPIDLYQVGEVYYVLDGHHRVSIAYLSGQTTIEANVWEFPTQVGHTEFSDQVEFILETK